MLALISLVFSGSHAVAFYAMPHAVISFSVAFVILVTLRAMRYLRPPRFERFYRGTIAETAAQVLLQSDWLKMFWIYAISDAAKMIQLQAFRNWTFMSFIRKSVSFDIDRDRVASIENDPVAADVKTSCPKPASALGDGKAGQELLVSIFSRSAHSSEFIMAVSY
jgi:hypothetical protein